MKRFINFLRKLFKKRYMILNHSELKELLLKLLKDRYKRLPITILSDEHYTTISKELVANIYRQSGLKNKQYESEVFDCDDFALTLKSLAVEAGRTASGVIAPYAFGIVYGHFPTPHAINWFIDVDKKLYFIEPQTGEILDPMGDNILFLYT